MIFLTILTIALILALLFARRSDAHGYDAAQLRARHVICQVFGSRCREALNVAWCESRYRTWAQNGQYLGLFQMGESERATYGHGSTALEQARAAYRYFSATGKDWSPWTCKP